MTGVSWWGHKVDNAYWLWNFQGKILKRSSVEKFCQLVWRPRYQRFHFHEAALISVIKQYEIGLEAFFSNYQITVIVNRPPTLLAKEQIKEIKKNLKKYSVKFNQKDAQR